MSSDKEPLDSIMKWYSYTINVSPNKFVMYLSHQSIQWKEMKEDMQKEHLANLVNTVVEKLVSCEHNDYVFEKCKNGMIHLHGRINCTEGDVICLQEVIYKFLGMPRLKKSIVMYYEETIFDIKFWNTYMQKQQVTNLRKDSPIERSEIQTPVNQHPSDFQLSKNLILQAIQENAVDETTSKVVQK